MEIFGRRNNLRNFWMTLGNEVVGSAVHVPFGFDTESQRVPSTA